PDPRLAARRPAGDGALDAPRRPDGVRRRRAVALPRRTADRALHAQARARGGRRAV
ncbi:MAG: hypothetical protein AVDCRST_MAG13-3630, partial [uncultured Solirubrobacteraceae bacterium]